MICTSCGRPLSFLRRGLPIGEDVLCPDCFAEVPPQGEMDRLARYYAQQPSEELLSILKKGTRRYRVYSLKAAKDELKRRGGPDAERARMLFSAIANVEVLEQLIDRHLAAGPSATPDRSAADNATELPSANIERIREPFLTTESGPGLRVSERLGILSSEAAISMRGIRDFLVGTIGTGQARSLTSLTELQTAKKDVLEALRQRATELGADAVVGITLRFEQLGAGINVMLVSASGTAVRVVPEGASDRAQPLTGRHQAPPMIPIYRFDPTVDESDNGDE